MQPNDQESESDEVFTTWYEKHREQYDELLESGLVSEAETLLRSGAKEGDPDAMLLLARVLTRSGSAEGMEWLMRAAERGNVDAMVACGNDLEYVRRDFVIPGRPCKSPKTIASGCPALTKCPI